MKIVGSHRFLKRVCRASQGSAGCSWIAQTKISSFWPGNFTGGMCTFVRRFRIPGYRLVSLLLLYQPLRAIAWVQYFIWGCKVVTFDHSFAICQLKYFCSEVLH